MAHGAIKKVLGFDDEEPINDVLLLGDVVVTPSERVYEKKEYFKNMSSGNMTHLPDFLYDKRC